MHDPLVQRAFAAFPSCYPAANSQFLVRTLPLGCSPPSGTACLRRPQAAPLRGLAAVRAPLRLLQGLLVSWKMPGTLPLPLPMQSLLW